MLSYVIQFTRYISVLLLSRRQLLHYIASSFICQELFSCFFKIFSCRIRSRAKLGYYITLFFICQYPISKKFGESLSRFPAIYIRIIPRLQSDRSHRHFSYTPLRKHHRCQHPGMRRRYDPAGSSASWPLLCASVSWGTA